MKARHQRLVCRQEWLTPEVEIQAYRCDACRPCPWKTERGVCCCDCHDSYFVTNAGRERLIP